MVQQLHHLHLPVHLGEVGGVQLGLVYDFDCDLKFVNVRGVMSALSVIELYCCLD